METPGLPLGSRRNEDIALDLMKFVAMTTSYGKTIGTGVGFQGGGATAKPEDYAAHLLELYSRCLQAVGGKELGQQPGALGLSVNLEGGKLSSVTPCL